MHQAQRHHAPLRLIALAVSLSLLLGALAPAAQAAQAAPGRSREASGQGVTTTGPIGYWRFNEGTGTTSADKSGGGRAATLVNGASWSGEVAPIAAANPFALGLDGVDDYAMVASNGAFDTASMTLAAWVRPTWTSGGPEYNPAIAALRSPAGTRWSWHIRSDYSHIDLYNGSTVTGFELPDSFVQNSWQHVAMTFVGGSVKLYLNGRLQGMEGSFLGGNEGLPLYIGSSTGQNEFFKGAIDEVRLYDRALSAGEVLATVGCGSSIQVTSAADSGTGSLRNAIARVCDGGTISFAGSYSIPLESTLALDKSLAIDGTGHSVVLSGTLAADLNRDGGIFDIVASTSVTLTRLRLTGGVARAGGAIYSEGALTIVDSSLSDNSASSGGAIRSSGASSSLTISNSSISDNTADYGGGIDNDGTLTIDDSVIGANEASNGGGGVYNAGTIVARDSVFSTNVAHNGGTLGSGGGLLNASGPTTSLLENVTFIQNKALGSGDDGGGAVMIYSGHVRISGGTLERNDSETRGGAISVQPALDTSLAITGALLLNNSAETNGGGIAVSGPASISASSILSNTADSEGGGIYNEGALVIADSTIAYNTASSFGGGVNHYSGTLELRASLLLNNDGGRAGGGLYAGEGSMLVENSTLSGNLAVYGGGVYIPDADLAGTIASSSIVSNTMTGILAGGGGLESDSTLALSLTNTLIAHNAGGADCQNTGGTGIITGTLIADGSCAIVAAGGLQGDPLLGPLGDYGGPTMTYGLLDGSPAIDAAVGAYCPAADQRGARRPQGPGCDIGAYERPAYRSFMPLMLAPSPS